MGNANVWETIWDGPIGIMTAAENADGCVIQWRNKNTGLISVNFAAAETLVSMKRYIAEQDNCAEARR